MEKVLESKRLLLAIVAALVLAVGLVGLTACGDSGSGSAASSGSQAASSDSAATSEATDGDVPAEFADLEPVTLIYADITGVNTVGHNWGEAIVKRASELTGGKLTIDYHPAGELGTGPDIMRQLQSNDVQFFYCEPSTVSSFIPEMEAFAVPMMFEGYTGDQIETVLNGDNDFTQGLQAACEKAGVRNMGFLQDALYRQATSNKPLYTLDDYKGLQIRVLDDKYHIAFWQALGAEPTPLAFSELYFALQNGTLEAEENGLDTFVGNSLQEVQKYVAFTNHILQAGIVFMNNDAYNNLDPAYQAALDQAFAETSAELRLTLRPTAEEALTIMKDSGMEVIEYDDAFFDEVQAIPEIAKLRDELDEYTGGLVTKLQAELDKAAA